jgi:transcriptional regulator NrdR family protein
MQTKDSRPTEVAGAPTVRRRRFCTVCGHRVTTYELTVEDSTKLEQMRRLSIELHEVTGRVKQAGGGVA